MNAEALASDLRAAISGEVRFDAGSRALYATDSSNYRQVPVGVVLPRDRADAVAAVAAARRYAAPLLGRGAGTSLAGQCCNSGVVVDFSKYMNRIVSVDPTARQARVEPGLVLDDLRAFTARHGLTFGPDPATHQYCTLGGMIGNNSCGVRSVMAQFYGPGPTTAHNVDALDVVTYRGLQVQVGATDDGTLRRLMGAGGPPAELYGRLKQFQERYADLIRREFPDIPRRVSGYNLPALLPENGFHVARALVGSESTLTMVLAATVHLLPALPCRVLVVVGFKDVFAAADAVPAVMEYRPVGLEGFDEGLASDLRRTGLDAGSLRLLPEGRGWLLVEFGAETRSDAMSQAASFAARVGRHPGRSVSVFDKPEDQHRLWEIRESGLAATARVSGEHRTWPGWEDSAVPPERFGEYLREIKALFDRHGYRADLYGHFGQGCLHCRVDFDLRTADAIARYRTFMEQAADLVHRFGGSLSGEHGDGQARGELLGRMFSRDMLTAFREFKSIWDPDWKMNPGKIIDANPLDANLRLGTGYDPSPIQTAFSFADDGGSFARATLRCVGVGKCRKDDAGTMCPSYMVTREEQHSTRGRARLLFEMLEGDPLDEGWRSEAVHEALDLCLACKGCKSECPVHVDMATYKAEFLSHYYRHHRRPRAAYAFGLIRTWARLASFAPRFANTVTQLPVLRSIAAAAAGVAPQRRMPAFAVQTFRRWFAARERSSRVDGRRVLLWPDTFNDHFHPETLRAAVEVLERSGYQVSIPPPLCCGRPLYDFGMLDAARERLGEVLATLAQEIKTGVPLVVLEPSCLAVFQDELRNLFPHDEDARRLTAQSRTLAGLLIGDDRVPDVRLERSAVVHGHCHQQALVGIGSECSLFDRLGLDHRLLDSGCCGMAGSFGFERGHYEVSMAVGERVLLPAVRQAPLDTLIVADGFSCREQIAQTTARRALHTAELLHLAMAAPATPPSPCEERRYVVDHSSGIVDRRTGTGGLLVAIGVSLIARAWRRRARHRAAA